ncbi:MAG: HNH endonuclease [Bryobacterales bacterium]|nr:HNH endonuclease [Bryobacterales bacterium]
MDTPVKRCTQCNEVKPISEFSQQKLRNGTYVAKPSCKTCAARKAREKRAVNPKHANEIARQYYQKHRDELVEKARQYRQNNPEKVKDANKRSRTKHIDKARQRRRDSYIQNRDKEIAQNRHWRHNNPQKYRIQRKRWRDKNADKLRELRRIKRLAKPEMVKEWKRRDYHKNKATYYAANHRRRARKLSLPDTFTVDDWHIALDYWRNLCAYCGSQQGLWNPMSADHFIPLSSPDCPGTVPENMIPACQSCNASKHNYDSREWAIKKFGKRKAAQILKRINAYFDWLKTQK